MTSEAKIGLLLGLVFIFIIAFVINGIPYFRKNHNNNELTTNMTSLENQSLGIGTKERKAQETLNWTEMIEKNPINEAQVPLGDKQDIRSVTSLQEDVSKAEGPYEDVAEKEIQTGNLMSAQQATWPKTYIVVDGDNLADIAIKFYGSQDGNKSVNINRIFEANRKILRTPNEIYVGQKLIMPSLPASTSGKNNRDSILSSGMFEKVESIGRKYLSSDNKSAKKEKWYTVREGDSLWKIAADQLGNGSRFPEISKLNADILSHEDNLAVGMRLRIPVR